MLYFRYGILNSLRVAVFLTLSWQRVTLFHLFMLMLPATLFGIAISAANSLIERLIAVLLAIGFGVFAWGIPRVIWQILQAALYRGWLVRTGEVPNEPAMTRQEYSQRYVRWRRDYFWYSGWCVAILLACCLTGLMAVENQRLQGYAANTILYSTSFVAVALLLFSVVSDTDSLLSTISSVRAVASRSPMANMASVRTDTSCVLTVAGDSFSRRDMTAPIKKVGTDPGGFRPVGILMVPGTDMVRTRLVAAAALFGWCVVVPSAQRLDPPRMAIDTYRVAIQRAQKAPARGQLEVAFNAIAPLREALVIGRDGGGTASGRHQESVN